jgi:hypothetical protein
VGLGLIEEQPHGRVIEADPDRLFGDVGLGFMNMVDSVGAPEAAMSIGVDSAANADTENDLGAESKPSCTGAYPDGAAASYLRDAP